MSTGIHRRVSHILDSNLKLSGEIRRLVRTDRFWVRGQKGRKSCRVDQESVHLFLSLLNKIDAMQQKGRGNPELDLRINRKELLRLLRFFEQVNRRAKKKALH